MATSSERREWDVRERLRRSFLAHCDRDRISISRSSIIWDSQTWRHVGSFIVKVLNREKKGERIGREREEDERIVRFEGPGPPVFGP